MARSAVTLAVAWLTVAISAPRGCAQGMGELEVDHALTFDYPTPHTDWAQPYALGKIRVLFFTDGRGTNPRECVELMQRFDIEGQAVFYARIVDSAKSHWHGGKTGEQRMGKLLEQKWDCYVFSGMSMGKMSSEQKVKVLKPVTEGAGIVFVGANQKDVLKAKNLIKPLPPFLARGPVGVAYTVGKGRGIRLPARPKIGYYEGWEVDYDYWQERLGRGVLWAAGKTPRLHVELTPEKQTFDRAEDVKRLRMRITGSVTETKPIPHLSVRGRTGKPISYVDVLIGKEGSDVHLPKLPAGEYHADFRLIGSAGVEAWATTPFKITSARSVADVKLDRGWGEIGDRIAGTVALKGPPVKNETVRVRLLDRRRRELVRKDIKAPTGAPRFEFEIHPWFPMLVTVEALVLEGKDEVARAYRYFRVTKRHHGRFNFLIWDTPIDTLAPYAEASLAKHGMTLQLRTGNPPLYVAAYETPWVPYTTRIMTRKTKDGIMKPSCWNDEQAVAAHVTAKAKHFLPARQHGVFVWSLGDEVATRGCCLSPHCARAYRKYLEEVYGSLDALNRSWSTTFASWDQVGLSKEGDTEEAHSLRQKNTPRWYDRQAFKSYNFVQFCQKYARAYEAIDPKAKTGFEGAGRFQQGDDIDLIVRTNKFWSPYPGTADEVIRSIAPRAFPRSNWMGYTKDANSLLGKYWRMATRGTDAVWWWRWDCIGRFHGWLAPDFRPFPAVKDIIQDTQILRDGLGDLLIRSVMLGDGIATLYSHPSVFAHKLSEGASYGGYEPAHVGMHEHMVRALGMQFRYVTDRMLRLGEFDPSKFKVLLLARAEAIGDKEAGVIRAFVRNGGMVIADVRPGVYDGRCKPRDKGVLDDLFGVKRTGRGKAKIATAEIQHAGGGSRIKKARVDPTVALAGGKAMGQAAGTPVVIVNRVGKGRAILLNFSADNAFKLHLPETPDATRAFVQTLFGQAGVQPVIGLADETGKRLRHCELIRWRNGGIEIAALFRQGGRKQQVTMTLPGAKHVYDLRSRKGLGEQKAVGTTLIPNRATFFVLCDRPAPVPVVKLGGPTAERGRVVTGSMSVPGAEGLHAFRIRVKVGNRALEWHDQNVIASVKPVSFVIPLAYNDPAGAYEVSAIDLFTNRPTTARLTVR